MGLSLNGVRTLGPVVAETLAVGTPSPVGLVDIVRDTRSGTDPTHAPPLLITGDIGANAEGIEFGHSNQTQMMGFGYNTIYAGGSTSQDISVLPSGGKGMGIGMNIPTAKCHIDQESSSGAKPVLRLDQADIDDTFIDFIGTSAADGSRSISSDTTEDSAKFGAVMIEINGTTKWIRIYDDES